MTLLAALAVSAVITFLRTTWMGCGAESDREALRAALVAEANAERDAGRRAHQPGLYSMADDRGRVVLHLAPGDGLLVYGAPVTIDFVPEAVLLSFEEDQVNTAVILPPGRHTIARKVGDQVGSGEVQISVGVDTSWAPRAPTATATGSM